MPNMRNNKTKKNILRTMRNKFPGARNLYKNENPTQKALWNQYMRNKKTMKTHYKKGQNAPLKPENVQNLRVLNTSGEEWKPVVGNGPNYKIPRNLYPNNNTSVYKKYSAVPDQPSRTLSNLTRQVLPSEFTKSELAWIEQYS